MKITKVVCNIDSFTTVAEILIDNNVYDFGVNINGIFTNIRINNTIPGEEYEKIINALNRLAEQRQIDGVYIYPEDGDRVEIC